MMSVKITFLIVATVLAFSQASCTSTSNTSRSTKLNFTAQKEIAALNQKIEALTKLLQAAQAKAENARITAEQALVTAEAAQEMSAASDDRVEQMFDRSVFK